MVGKLVTATGQADEEKALRIIIGDRKLRNKVLETVETSDPEVAAFRVQTAWIESQKIAGLTRALATAYADDVAWVVKGNSIRDLVALMEACASATNSWARRNNVEFDLAKTEAIIFSRRKDRPDRGAARIRIGTEKIGFNMNATRWLGVWMDSKINLREHHNICRNKAKGVEARI